MLGACRRRLAAARYVELNPVRAKLVDKPEAYGWSSAPAHLAGVDDGLAKVAPLLDMVGDWRSFLAGGFSADEHTTLRTHERTGRPLGDEGFVERLESALGRRLKKRKLGPKQGSAENPN